MAGDQSEEDIRRNNSLRDQKIVEYYSQIVNGWLTTSFELDRSLLTVATLGLGFHIAFMKDYGISSPQQLIFLIVSMLAFLICVICVLFAFKINRSYFEQIIDGTAQDSDPRLASIDIAASISFAVGLIFSVLLALGIAMNTYQKDKGNDGYRHQEAHGRSAS